MDTKDTIIQKIINKQTQEIPILPLLDYFCNNTEFEEIDYPLFIHFFICFHYNELIDSSILDNMTVDNFAEIEQSIVLCFFETFLEKKSSEHISMLFCEYLSSLSDIDESIKTIRAIIALFECEKEVALELIERFGNYYKEKGENVDVCVAVLQIIFDLSRKLSDCTIDLSEHITFIIENDLINKVGLRQFCIAKFAIFDEETQKLATDFVISELSVGKKIPEYTRIFNEWLNLWTSDDYILKTILETIMSSCAEKYYIRETSELVVILLSSLQNGDPLWNELFEIIVQFFISPEISSIIFLRFVERIDELPLYFKNKFIENDEMMEKASELEDDEIMKYFPLI